MNEEIEQIAKKLWPDEEPFVRKTKRGDWEIGYINDYPLQHGSGKRLVIPVEILPFLAGYAEAQGGATGEPEMGERGYYTSMFDKMVQGSELWVNRKRGTFNPSKLFDDDVKYISQEELKKVGDFEKAYIHLIVSLNKFMPFANLISTKGTIFYDELDQLKNSIKHAQDITWTHKAFEQPESPTTQSPEGGVNDIGGNDPAWPFLRKRLDEKNIQLENSADYLAVLLAMNDYLAQQPVQEEAIEDIIEDIETRLELYPDDSILKNVLVKLGKMKQRK